MTVLPESSDFTGPVTEGSQKTFINNLRAFIAGLLGTDGQPGMALATLGALLSVYSAKSAAYTVQLADRGKLIDATSGTWTLDLPAASSAGNGFSFRLRNSGTGTITIDPSGSELVDGLTTTTVPPGGGADIICTGTAWVMQRLISRTMSTADFRLFDPTDNTKQIQFSCAGISPGSTPIIGFPNTNGNVILSSQSTTPIGNVATASTVNVGVGVTTIGITKEVNLGPLGLSGSITNVNVGSQVSGALGTTTFFSPTVAFGASVTAINLPDAATFLVDNADPTKKVQFQLSGITTGATRTVTLQDSGGTMAYLNTNQDFTGQMTFSSNFVFVGIGTGTSQYYFGDGVTTTGNTKAVRLGTRGASGSTTNIEIGSNTGGALGTLTINSPTVTFGASVTAINLPDAATFLVDNGDATKKLQFQLGGITTGTTRTVTAPDASGTMVLDTATQTLTNKSIAATQLTGTIAAAQMPAQTGDVTNPAGSLALTIAANAVSNAKLATMAANTIKANATSGAAVPTDVALSASQLLGRGATGNVAPITLGTNLSMTGTTLNATGGGGGSGVDLTTAQTVAGVKTFSDPVGMAAQTSTPAAPASGVLLYGQSVAGMLAAKVRGVGNRAAVLQAALWDRRTVQFSPNNAQGSIAGSAYTTSGDVVYNVGQSTTSAYSACARSAWRNLATTANQSMGFSTTTAFFRGNAAGVGGFFFHARAGFESWTNGGRMFVGMGTGGGDVSNEPGFLFKGCGFVIESGDAGLISFMTRSGYNTNTKVSTGLTAVTGKGYDFHIFCEPNTSQITWMIRDVNTGTEVSGTATTNLWTNTVDAAMSVFAGNAALTTLGAINFSVASAYAEVVGG